MCTLVIAFYPKSKYPLVIGANRDENPNRPSEDWAFREKDFIFCPLDIRGGTWVGINRAGIFCAITNWDVAPHDLHGMQSRGEIVFNTLKCHNLSDVIYYWETIPSYRNKPFNIIAGNKTNVMNFSCNHYNKDIIDLPAGVHISTGWGVNRHVKREKFLRNKLKKNFEFNTPVEPEILRKLMSSHNDGIGSEHSICVHDQEHRWETRSNAIISLSNEGWWTSWVNGPPCKEQKCNHKNVEIV